MAFEMTVKSFIHDRFLLHSDRAVELYEGFARDEPIIDFHCHLPPADIARNRKFENLFDIWLAGDHYKWRAMRSNGVQEKYCTGEADPYDKFLKWAETVPYTLRNPLYHWTHLELKRHFDVDELLGPDTAPAIWEKASRLLGHDNMRAQPILERFKVKALCTTDDPTDDLQAHRQIAASGLSTKVVPTFRPDKAMALQEPGRFNQWVAALEKAADKEIISFDEFLDALKKRHDFFHQAGCRISDHGLEKPFKGGMDKKDAAAAFDKARASSAPSPDEAENFGAFLMHFFGVLDAERDWTMQLHLGAMRNNNTRLFQALGPDTGFDSIGDFEQGRPLSRFLDRLDREKSLPRTILFNLNPQDFYLFASMPGNFQDGSVPGKMQLGSGWWFLDHKEGMEWQMNALSNLGLLSRFVGMLTDSRSFMSFPRHEYFRRVLCNLLGKDMENGEIPDDLEMIGAMVKDICFENARQYFSLGI